LFKKDFKKRTLRWEIREGSSRSGIRGEEVVEEKEKEKEQNTTVKRQPFMRKADPVQPATLANTTMLRSLCNWQ
jgi:hypothetical protein